MRGMGGGGASLQGPQSENYKHRFCSNNDIKVSVALPMSLNQPLKSADD